MSHSARKEMPNSAIFNFRWNAGSDWISLTEVGREFHYDRTETKKLNQSATTSLNSFCQVITLIHLLLHLLVNSSISQQVLYYHHCWQIYTIIVNYY